MEVLANEIYTTRETLSLLKISKSTFLRLIKRGALSAAKVGGQYRVLGEEILALFNPRVRSTAKKVMKNFKRRIESLS